jgi:hypothetical protein
MWSNVLRRIRVDFESLNSPFSFLPFRNCIIDSTFLLLSSLRFWNSPRTIFCWAVIASGSMLNALHTLFFIVVVHSGILTSRYPDAR